MLRFRRFFLACLIVLPPLFAWGCAPIPTWSRLVGKRQFYIFSQDVDQLILAELPDELGVRNCELVDAGTGRTRKTFQLPAHITYADPLPDGRIPLRTPGDDQVVVFDPSGDRPSQIIHRSASANTTYGVFVDPTGRWLLYFTGRREADGMDKPTVAIHDLQSGATRNLPGLWLWHPYFLNDGRHAVLRVNDVPGQYAPSKYVCVDLATGDVKWRTSFDEEYSFAQSIPEKHWVVFRPSFYNPNDRTVEKWLVLDDRDGSRIAEWSHKVAAVSRHGAVVEWNDDRKGVTISSESVRFKIDFGDYHSSRMFQFLNESGASEHFLSADYHTLVDFESLGIAKYIGWKTLERYQNREWDLSTGAEVVSEVQHHFFFDAYAWNGVRSRDGSYEIQTFDLFGIRAILRVERPARKNWPLRTVLAVLPAILVAAIARRRRLHRSAAA